MRILQVADRPGWAIDRLSKPLSEMNDDIDMSYLYDDKNRFLATGYTELSTAIGFDKIDRKDYDIIHLHRDEAAPAIFGGLGQEVRRICSKHTERDEGKHWNEFDDIICSTIACYDQMKNKNLSRPRIHFVPQGIDLKNYYYEFIEPEGDAVGYVGRVVPWKRFDKIANACAEIKVKFNAVGYIEDNKTFKNHNYIGRPEYKWISFLPERNMRRFYNQLSLFVSISLPMIETGPLPVLEALACGVPVLTTPVGWAKDWGTHGENIWFIRETDIGNLAMRIRNLLDRKDILQRLKQNSIRLAENFSIEKYNQRMRRIYENKDFISTPDLIRKEIYG